MNFLDFLKSKTNLLFFYFGFILFANYVNHFDIRGKIEWKEYSNYNFILNKSINIFQEGCSGRESFWPLDVFFYNDETWHCYDTTCEFYGIFNAFGLKETLFYSVSFFFIFFLYWYNKIKN